MDEKKLNMVKETNTGMPIRSLEPGQEIACTPTGPFNGKMATGGDPINMVGVNNGTEYSTEPIKAPKKLKQGRYR